MRKKRWVMMKIVGCSGYLDGEMWFALLKFFLSSTSLEYVS